MKAEKWNYEKSRYDICDVSDDAEDIVDDKVVCVNCKKMIHFKTAYRSKEYRLHGVGLPVCTDCFDVECAKRQIYYGTC